MVHVMVTRLSAPRAGSGKIWHCRWVREWACKERMVVLTIFVLFCWRCLFVCLSLFVFLCFYFRPIHKVTDEALSFELVYCNTNMYKSSYYDETQFFLYDKDTHEYLKPSTRIENTIRTSQRWFERKQKDKKDYIIRSVKWAYPVFRGLKWPLPLLEVALGWIDIRVTQPLALIIEIMVCKLGPWRKTV